MNFSLTINFRADSGDSEHFTPYDLLKGECQMADWVDELVRKTKQKYGDQRVTDEKYVLEQKQKQAAGTAFMKRLYKSLDEARKEFNLKMGGASVISVQSADKSITTRATFTQKAQKTVEARYSDQLFSIDISGPDDGMSDEFPLSLVGGVAMANWKNITGGGVAVQFSADDLAREIFTKLLRD